MAVFKPFRALRPTADSVGLVASRPYDVLNSKEAKEEAKGNELSFLRVIKPEIGLPEGVDQYSDEVYEYGVHMLGKLKSQGILKKDSSPNFYIYRLTMGSHSQTGIVGCCHFQEYYKGIIKKHELTRPVKENDRVRHVKSQNANAEPVFFSYRRQHEIDALVDKITNGIKAYDFVADDEIRHELWLVSNSEIINQIESSFQRIPSLYVADGHHRTAAAARVGQERMNSNPNHSGEEEYNFFMTVLFPDNQLKIYDYNRVVRDLNGLTVEDFLEKLRGSFSISPMEIGKKPVLKGNFTMYLAGKWYEMVSTNTSISNTTIGKLDVTYLSEKVLNEILGITDLRKDERIDFVGGIRGLKELKKRVDSGEMKAAFALFPVSMEEIISISDAGEIMPPKTTWFEPKLRSGLFIHDLE